jgi:hypothetical protein
MCQVEKKRMCRVAKSICVPPPTTYQPIQVKQERAEKQPCKTEPDELLEETETKDSKQLVDKLVIESVVKPRAGTASMSIRVKVEKLEEGGPQNSNIHYREGGIDICTIDRDGSVNAVTPSNGESKVSFRPSEVTSDTLHSVPGDLVDGEITQSSNSYSKRHRMVRIWTMLVCALDSAALMCLYLWYKLRHLYTDAKLCTIRHFKVV